ncbi:hypothetical protein GCM10010193_14520 [Kitasatospora atroaurantiaca]|uniref:non-specific serine/threonine protein kinase n=1 Tax=Kitasatospora atroaurantiaca TaxID=285545 RepID=A0A561EI98_9ACTN|nr:serine/threonine-protein kinase [Kitasatospora atroaurantiaca]TWE15340.1 serine/threonine protein kinase [Kitasatospora atroaurantiaca]
MIVGGSLWGNSEVRTELPEPPGYRVVEVLGQGGFATVYRAHQLAVGREVALKIDSRVLSDTRDRQRFLREVTAAGQLSSHPNVVALYDAGVLADGRPFMVLELCPNGSLADRLRTSGRLPATEARAIGVRIADALAAAHASGVLHRDVKPGNIMINRYNSVALTDFGLAAMPRPGHELSVTRGSLTPAYAPPEAFRMADPSPAGDVYSLAASVYALLRGRPPHYPDDGDLSLAELIVRHTQPVPDLPGVPPALSEILRHAMAADPADRMPDAAMLRDALDSVDLGTVPLAGPSPVRPAAEVPLHARPTVPQASATEPEITAAAETVPATIGGRRRRFAFVGVPLLALASAGLAVTGFLALQDNDSSDDTKASAPSTSSSRPAETRGGSSSAGVDFTVPSVTDGCPAADVAGAGARCPATAECWGGLVAISGLVTVTRTDCTKPHYWETFAIAPLPADRMTNNQHELKDHPLLLRLCSTDVLTRSRKGSALAIPPENWETDFIPPSPTDFAKGVRVFRCVGSVSGGELAGAKFRPGA